MKRGLPYGVLVTQVFEQCGVTFPRDVVTLPQGLPIDDTTIKRMEGQRLAVSLTAQAIRETVQPVPAPICVPAPAEVPSPALETTIIADSSTTSVPPAPTSSEVVAPAL